MNLRKIIFVFSFLCVIQETVNEYLIRCEKEPTVFNLKNLWKILQLVNHVLYCKRYLIPNYEILLDYIVDAMAINFQSSRLELHKIIRCLLQTIFVNRPKNELRDRFPQTFRQVNCFSFKYF